MDDPTERLMKAIFEETPRKPLTKAQQRQFVRAMIASVGKQIMDRADRWPTEWDGNELCVLVADTFKSATRWSEISKYPTLDRTRRFNCHHELSIL